MEEEAQAEVEAAAAAEAEAEAIIAAQAQAEIEAAIVAEQEKVSQTEDCIAVKKTKKGLPKLRIRLSNASLKKLTDEFNGAEDRPKSFSRFLLNKLGV